MSKAKRSALILLVISAVLVSIVAAGLPDLVLYPAQPFSLPAPQLTGFGLSGDFPGGEVLYAIFRGAVALAIILLPVYIIYSLFTPEGRRRLIVNIITIILLVWFANYLRELPLTDGMDQLEEALNAGQEGDSAGEGIAVPVFTPDPPQWLTLTVMLATSVFLAVTILAAIWYVRQRRRPDNLFFDDLAAEVQSAIVSIREGGDLKSTIVRCYQEMSRVLEDERGITRESTMTPREFEQRLVDKGLPETAIRTLTRLFEQVRYGSLSFGPREEQLALVCLTEIVDACKTVGEQHEQQG